MLPPVPLEGLPAGVLAVRLTHETEPLEYIFYAGNIRQVGGGCCENPTLVVKAAPGYEFRYDVSTDCIVATKAVREMETVNLG